MSVQKFTTSNTTNMTEFYAWLNTYKSDSFLKDFTIAISDTVSTGDTITITGENNDVIFNTRTYGYEGAGVVTNILQCSTVNGYQAYTMTDSAYERAVYISGALLCNNGIIIKLYLHSHYTNSNYYATEYIIIGKDDKNNLCIVVPKKDANGNTSSGISTNNIGFRAVCYDESKVANVTVSTTYSESKTSLCPILVDSNYDSTLIEIYQSLQTQLNNSIFDSVTIGDDTFISNGYWYIKD